MGLRPAFFFLLPAVLAAVSPALALAQLEASVRELDLGTVAGDQAVERTFTVTNRSDEAMRIRDVQLTPPLVVTKMKATIEPGQTSVVTVRVGSPRPAGRFEGQVSVNFEGVGDALVIVVRAEFAAAIEFRPRQELVAVTSRGVPAHDSVEIVSHLPDPVELAGGAVSNDRYSTRLEVLEPGRRWRLSLLLSGGGPAGKRTDTLTLSTTDPAHPAIPVRVRTSLRERVYTFPDQLDFGRIAAAGLTPEKAALFETSVMVYQKDGRDFEVKVSTDVPFLVVRPEKSAKFTDRWQIFCSIDPAKLAPGQTGGTITIETTDPEFRKLVVPVRAAVE